LIGALIAAASLAGFGTVALRGTMTQRQRGFDPIPVRG
jgi:hypothetical protein